MAWCAGAVIVRDAVGPEVVALLANQTEFLEAIEPTLDNIQSCDAFNTTCEYGLINDNGVNYNIPLISILIKCSTVT